MAQSEMHGAPPLGTLHDDVFNQVVGKLSPVDDAVFQRTHQRARDWRAAHPHPQKQRLLAFADKFSADPQLDDIIDRLKNTPYPNRNNVGVELADGIAGVSESDVQHVCSEAVTAKLSQITAIDTTDRDYWKKALELSGGKRAVLASVVVELVDSIVNPIADENVPLWALDVRAQHDDDGNFFLLLAPASQNVAADHWITQFRLAQPGNGVLSLEIMVGTRPLFVFKITARSPGPFPTTVREFMGRLLTGRDKTIEPRPPGTEVLYIWFDTMMTTLLIKSGLFYLRDDDRAIMVSGAFVDMAA